MVYQKLLFYGRVGYWPNFDNPRSFNEKICWIKFYYRDPRLPLFTDKLAVREYVRKVAPEVNIPEVYFVVDRPEDIPFDKLPERCVIKPNNASKRIIFYEKGNSNTAEVRRIVRKWLNSPYGWDRLEWAYENIKPLVLGEELLLDETENIPDDYKVFVLGGKALLISVISGRFVNQKRSYYDRYWNRIDITRGRYPKGPEIPKPDCLEKMLSVAERLADDLALARVDFYIIKGKLYFGEMTFYPESGMGAFHPREFDFKFGAELLLPCSHREERCGHITLPHGKGKN